MIIELSPLLARFVTSMNSNDLAAVGACFTEDSTVENEGQVHPSRCTV